MNALITSRTGTMVNIAIQTDESFYRKATIIFLKSIQEYIYKLYCLQLHTHKKVSILCANRLSALRCK